MRLVLSICTLFFLLALPAGAQKRVDGVSIDCFGEVMQHRFSKPVTVWQQHPSTAEEITNYAAGMEREAFLPLIGQLKDFKQRHNLDDWLYYQLIRRIAEQLAPKAEDYTLYTLYKWHLLTLSGYDAILTHAEGRILFYVRCDDNIYNIPLRRENGISYVCLNYHDYGNIDFNRIQFSRLNLSVPEASRSFSYAVHSIPELKKDISEKDINFTYNNAEYHFRIKLNPSIATYFRNYPSTDYEKHFNIPLSTETYNSLIPAMKKQVKRLNPRDGVDFLMHFTRYSFLFKPDTEKYGMEKIYSPEMTLLSESSDCEDRVSLFYYLVKELYDLPMIVVVYPKHVSIAVHFDKAFGKTIEYNGKKFTICEPTPQQKDLKMGESLPELNNTPYQIAFAYEPAIRKNK